MYNECFLHMSKTLRKDISFSHKVQMMQAKMNSYLNIPVYSAISLSNIKYENKQMRAAYSHKHLLLKDEQHFK